MEAFIPIIYLASIILAGVLASKKKRSVIGWVVGSILLSPLIILILLFISPLQDVKAHITANGPDGYPQDVDTKKCPFCAEHIREEAVVCRFCTKDMPEAEPTA